MTKVDISSEAVERLATDICNRQKMRTVGVKVSSQAADALRAQAERIKELEAENAEREKMAQALSNIDGVRNLVIKTRNDALREAVVKCQAEVTAARDNGCSAQAMGAMWCKKAVYALIEGYKP